MDFPLIIKGFWILLSYYLYGKKEQVYRIQSKPTYEDRKVRMFKYQLHREANIQLTKGYLLGKTRLPHFGTGSQRLSEKSYQPRYSLHSYFRMILSYLKEQDWRIYTDEEREQKEIRFLRTRLEKSSYSMAFWWYPGSREILKTIKHWFVRDGNIGELALTAILY